MGTAEWKLILASGFAAVLSLLKGSAASIFGKDGSCSLITGKAEPESGLDDMFGDS